MGAGRAVAHRAVSFPFVALTATAPQPAGVAPLSAKLTGPPSGMGPTLAVYVTSAPTTTGWADERSASRWRACSRRGPGPPAVALWS